MQLFPNAKINIGLNILEKRSDGYHTIETVFYPLSLTDELVVEVLDPSSSTANTGDYKYNITGMSLDADPEDNLVIKAYRLLQQSFNLGPMNVALKKNIPFGAGLGGGSSDAAYMLKALNQLFTLNLSPYDLENYAGQLGADCPFFINNKVVFATGIGDVFSPIDISLKGYYIMLIKPDIFVPTPTAYASIVPKMPTSSLYENIKKPVSEWKNVIVNDFEPSVFSKYPLIGHIKNLLYDKGAVYASMSGSGASVYGIFEHYPSGIKEFEDYFTYVALI